MRMLHNISILLSLSSPIQSRDRMGTKKAKPLWTEIMELMGGEYLEAKDSFYAEGAMEQEEE